MSRISQSFEFAVIQPSITWRQDTVLETPLLRFPLDEVRFCPQMYLLKGFSAGLILYWNSVPSASFYVVQIADNQSFSGPDVRAVKTTDLQLELQYVDHLRAGDQFFWRVAAYNLTGGASVMSEVRSVKIACPENQGVSFKNEGSDYADIDSPKFCDHAGVDIELGGPQWVRKTDSERTWVLNVNYDCDSFEGHEVRIDDVIWEVRQSAQQPVTVDVDTNDYIKLDISAYQEEWFELIAHVIFELVGVGYFECKASKKILIEGTPIGSGSSTKIWFRVIGTVNDILWNSGCEGVYAIVTRVSCGSSVQVGDEVMVFDPDLCWFNLPIELLMRFRGTATWAENNGAVGPDICPDVPVPGECIWIVDGACCLEEVYA